MQISIKGKVGTSVVVVDANGYQNLNQDLAKIVLKQGYNPFIYSTYFATKYEKGATKKGQINPFLGLGNIKTIQIPLFSNQFSIVIEHLIRRGMQARCISSDMYRKAEFVLFNLFNIAKLMNH